MSDLTEQTEQQILDQSAAIQAEVVENQPLISELQSIDNLLANYQNAELPGFVPGIHYLANKFKLMRKVCGDGNCFYRAFLFGYLDILVRKHASGDAELVTQATTERDRVLSIAKGSLAELVALGYSEFTIETFYDEFVEALETLFELTPEALLARFLEENGPATYYTWFMRLLTAGFIKRDPERFTPFLEGSFLDIDSFCKSEVEPMNKECEQIQIIALTEYLGVSVHISYLDGRLFDEASGLPLVIFPDPSSDCPKGEVAVQLLYRPGHYDILYAM